MNDEPPTKPESPQSMPPPRRQATSSADWVEAVTGTHSFDSSPPGVMRALAMLAYYQLWIVRESWKHRAIILHWIALSGGLTALAHHFWRW